MFTEALVWSRLRLPPANRLGVRACGVLLGSAAATNIWGALIGESQSGSTFHLLMAGLSIYLLVEIIRHLRRTDSFGLIAPPFLASLLHFFLSYVMPAAGTLFDPWILDRFGKYYSSQPEQLVDVAILIGLAAFCMWRGYDLGLSLTPRLRQSLQRSSLLRGDLQPAMLPVLGLQVGYFLLVTYAISLGVFGMTSSEEMRERHVDLLEALNLGMAGGSLALLLLLTYVFRRRAQGHSEIALAIACGVFVCLHVVLGAISGFKSQIVTPFVMVAFAKFIATRKISMVFIGASCCALLIAYQVIEPFRAYISRDGFQGASDISTVLKALQKSREQKDLMPETDLSWGTHVVSRFDLTGMTSVGILFAASDPLVAAKSAEFAESLYLALPYAFVPRALWLDKPTYASGVWFSNIVLGNMEDRMTSVGMGPITWLYMVGGTLGVVLGFIGIGMLQAVMFDGFARSGAGGLILFLATVMPLVIIPTDVGPVLIGILRILPIAFAAQFLLLRPQNRLSKVRVP